MKLFSFIIFISFLSLSFFISAQNIDDPLKSGSGSTATIEEISSNSYYGEYQVYVSDKVNGPVFFPSNDVLGFGDTWSFDIDVYAIEKNDDYYLNIENEPGWPWNCFFGSFGIGENSSQKVALDVYQSYTYRMGVYPPDYSDMPSAKITLKLRTKSLLGIITTHDTREIEVISDCDAPSTAVNQLPETTDFQSFIVRWSGSDLGVGTSDDTRSGIQYYDVQYKVDNGYWQDWVFGTSSTSRTFSGEPGKTYYFRCRARDNVGNLEPFPESYDAYTNVNASEPDQPQFAFQGYFNNSCYGDEESPMLIWFTIIGKDISEKGLIVSDPEGYEAPKYLSMTGGSGDTDEIIYLSEGTYSVVAYAVVDGEIYYSSSETIVVSSSATKPLSASFDIADIGSSNIDLSLKISGGMAPYMYNIQVNDDYNWEWVQYEGSHISLNELMPGSYYQIMLTITDARGCSYVYDLEVITEAEPPEIEVTSVEFLNDAGENASSFAPGDSVTSRVTFQNTGDYATTVVTLAVGNYADNSLIMYNSHNQSPVEDWTITIGSYESATIDFSFAIPEDVEVDDWPYYLAFYNQEYDQMYASKGWEYGFSTTTSEIPDMLLDVPHYYQGTTYWCWANALSMLLKYYGHNKRPWEIANHEVFKKSINGGILGTNVDEYLDQEFKLADDERSWSGSPGDFHYLKEYLIAEITNKRPVWMLSYEGIHTRVVIGVNETSVYVLDPHGDNPIVEYTWTEFQNTCCLESVITNSIYTAIPSSKSTNPTLSPFSYAKDATIDHYTSLGYVPILDTEGESSIKFYNSLNGDYHKLVLKFDGNDDRPWGYKYVALDSEFDENNYDQFYPTDDDLKFKATLADRLDLSAYISNSSLEDSNFDLYFQIFSCDNNWNELELVFPAEGEKESHVIGGNEMLLLKHTDLINDKPIIEIVDSNNDGVIDNLYKNYTIKFYVEEGGEVTDETNFNFSVANSYYARLEVVDFQETFECEIGAETFIPFKIKNSGKHIDNEEPYVYLSGLVEFPIKFYEDFNNDLMPDGDALTSIDGKVTLTEIASGITKNFLIGISVPENTNINDSPILNNNLNIQSSIDKQYSKSIQFDIELVPNISQQTKILAVSPNVISEFGLVTLGESVTSTLVLSNSGNTALSVTNLLIAGTNSSNFEIVSPVASSFDIPAGSSQEVVVRFTPSSTGGKIASFTISNDSDNSPNKTISLSGTGTELPTKTLDVSPALSYDYGSVTMGESRSKTFVLSNSGNTSLTLSELSVSGTNSSNFEIVSPGTSSFEIPAGSSQEVEVRFTPSSAGGKTALLTISNDSDNSPNKTIGLSGTGTELPTKILDVSPALSYDYGSVTMGESRSKTFVLSNSGNTSFTVSELLVSGTNSSNFEIVSPGAISFEIPAGSSQEVEVRFTPSSAGGKTASFTIRNDSDNSSNKTISLSGTGTELPTKTLDVTPALSYDYGSVSLGESRSKTFVLSNSGNTSFTVSDLSVSGTNSSNFEIVSPGTSSFEIPAGSSQEVEIRFTPSSSGGKSASFSISNNSDNQPTKTITLSGTGTNLPTKILDITPALSYDFGTLTLGESKTTSIVLSNSGNTEVNVSGISLSGTNSDDFVILSPGSGSFTISAGSSQEVEVRFTPSSVGGKTASLSILNDSDNSSDKVINLTGNGQQISTNEITSLTINGPKIINENSSTSYTCIATYANGSTKVVTDSVNWTENSDFATFSSGGVLNTQPVDLDENVTISAGYLGKTTTYDVTIINIEVSSADWILANANEVSNGEFGLTAKRNRTEYAYIDVIWDGKSNAHISYDLYAPLGFSYEEFIRFGLFKKGFHENFDYGEEPGRYFDYGYADGQSGMKAKISITEYGSFGMNPVKNKWYTYSMDYDYNAKSLLTRFIDESENVVFEKSFENILFDFETDERELGFFSKAIDSNYGNPSETILFKNLQYYFSSIPTSSKEYLCSENLKIYPNPTTGMVVIDFDDKIVSEIEVAVFSIDGTRVFMNTYLPSDKIRFDISKYVSGMYFVKIIADNREEIRKLILKEE